MTRNERRQKTNSITHLVKIVAQEVVAEEMSSHFEGINKRLTALELVSGQPKLIDTSEAMRSIKNELDKVGGSWSKNESKLLDKELTLAIAAIAANHGRTVGAIKARIDRYDLIQC